MKDAAGLKTIWQVSARKRPWLSVVVIAVLAYAAPSSLAIAGVTERVSVTSDGSQAEASSSFADISGDGRFVAFVSKAALLKGDEADTEDAFVYDRLNRSIEGVTYDLRGRLSNEVLVVGISANGRYVVFDSDSADLVSGDTDENWDIFVRDLATDTTERINVSSTEEEANFASPVNIAAISADGRYIAFASQATNLVPGDTSFRTDIFVRDRLAGTTERVSVSGSGVEANGPSFRPALSGDGRYVGFYSNAANLVAGDTNGGTDVFVHDRVTGAVERVSVDSSENEAPVLRAGQPGRLAISADGRFVAFDHRGALVPDDTNGGADIYLRDRLLGTTTRVSQAASGGQANALSFNPDMTDDGRFISFHSAASDIVPVDTNTVLGHDTKARGATASPGDDVFVYDRLSGMTTRESVDGGGNEANGQSRFATIAADGTAVAFHSFASNLVAGDTNKAVDVFVHELGLAR